jgi:hypothetical protein
MNGSFKSLKSNLPYTISDDIECYTILLIKFHYLKNWFINNKNKNNTNHEMDSKKLNERLSTFS